MRFARAGWVVVGSFPLVTAGAALLEGCPSPAPSPPPPASNPASGKGGPCPLVGVVDGGPTHNDMPWNDMPWNDLDPNVLRSVRGLLQTLATQPLNDQTAGSLSKELADPEPNGQYAARTVMKFIVECALDGSATLQGTPQQVNGGGVTWSGELGLCGAGSRVGDWHAAPPTQECLESVSACLLARVNALGKKVIISVRGEPSERFPLRDRVPVEREYRENGGTPILSFSTCPAGTAPSAAFPDCGWQAQYVGRCEVRTAGGAAAGGDVTLHASAATQVRVCAGLYGCNATPSSVKGAQPPPYYGGQLVKEGDVGPQQAFTFPCQPQSPPYPTWPPVVPPNPNPGTQYAYYGVMIRGAAGQVTVTATPGEYPATEPQVFTWREGAFYGSVFGQAPHTKAACYSDVWNYGAAHMNGRICAGPWPDAGCDPGPDAGCGISIAGACAKQPKYGPSVSCQADRCAKEDGPECTGDHDYKDCLDQDGAPPPWQWPVSVFLNHPCDLSASFTDPACRLAGP